MTIIWIKHLNKNEKQNISFYGIIKMNKNTKHNDILSKINKWL